MSERKELPWCMNHMPDELRKIADILEGLQEIEHNQSHYNQTSVTGEILFHDAEFIMGRIRYDSDVEGWFYRPEILYYTPKSPE